MQEQSTFLVFLHNRKMLRGNSLRLVSHLIWSALRYRKILTEANSSLVMDQLLLQSRGKSHPRIKSLLHLKNPVIIQRRSKHLTENFANGERRNRKNDGVFSCTKTEFFLPQEQVSLFLLQHHLVFHKIYKRPQDKTI